MANATTADQDKEIEEQLAKLEAATTLVYLFSTTGDLTVPNPEGGTVRTLAGINSAIDQALPDLGSISAAIQAARAAETNAAASAQSAADYSTSAQDAKSAAQSSAADAAVSLQNVTDVLTGYSGPEGLNKVGRFNSWSTMKSTAPSAEGVIVQLDSWSEGTGLGGGVFKGTLVASSLVDDGGMVAKPDGATYAWVRQIDDLNKLNVLMFGAQPITASFSGNCDDAVKAMYAWSLRVLPRLGIQFPAGKFRVTSLDYSATYSSYFRLVGAYVSYGYLPTTTLVFDKMDSSVAFKVQARWTEIANLWVDGESTSTSPNTKAFFQNTCQSGEFARITNIRFANVGGRCISLLDTLDTKIDQFYAQDCSGGVIYSTWSNNPSGNWQHITAIEMTNFNIQRHTGDAQAIDLQRAGQSFLRNGWIEKTTNPGDLSNGQWIIEGLSMEDCLNPFNLTHCRYILTQQNLQGTSRFITDDPNKRRWLSAYERGSVHIENHGSRFRGAMSYSWLSSLVKFSNTSSSAVWINLGKYTVTDANDITKIKFMGADGAAAVSSGAVKYGDNNFGGGEALLMLRRVPGSGTRQDASVEVHGRCPIADIRLSRPYENDVQIYVQLRANTGNVTVQVETSSKNRFEAGICFQWDFNGTIVEDSVINGMTLYTPRKSAAWGTMDAGMIFREDKVLSLLTAEVVDQQLKLGVNGRDYLLQLLMSPIGSDSFNRTGEIDKTKMDNYFGGSNTISWYDTIAKGCITDATTRTLSINRAAAGVVTNNAGISDYTIEFKLVSGPSSNAADAISTTFDFRRSSPEGGQNCFRLSFMDKINGVTNIRLTKRISGVNTTISPSDSTIADGQVLKVKMFGSLIQVYKDNSLIWSVTDTQNATGTIFGFTTAPTNTGITIGSLKYYDVNQ